MILGIHHVAIHTPDIDRLRSFYEKAFGFELARDEMKLEDFPDVEKIVGIQGASARVCMMKAGNCFVEMFQWATPKGRPPQPLNPNDFGYTHFCIFVSDIDKEFDRLSELGMTFVNPGAVKTGPYGSVYGRDPDGNVIEIMQAPEGDPFYLKTAEALLQ